MSIVSILEEIDLVMVGYCIELCRKTFLLVRTHGVGGAVRFLVVGTIGQ